MNDIIKRAEQIDGMMPTGDLELLYNMATKYITEGGIAVEIGSWKGRSSYVFAAVCAEKKAQFISIDTFAGSPHRDYDTYREALQDPDKFFNENIKKNLAEFPTVQFIKENSETAHIKLKDQSVDLCFIDGDHDDPGVTNDIKSYLSKMKKGGMYFGHDWFEDDRNDVKKACDKILGKDKYTLEGGIWTYQC